MLSMGAVDDDQWMVVSGLQSTGPPSTPELDSGSGDSGGSGSDGGHGDCLRHRSFGSSVPVCHPRHPNRRVSQDRLICLQANTLSKPNVDAALVNQIASARFGRILPKQEAILEGNDNRCECDVTAECDTAFVQRQCQQLQFPADCCVSESWQGLPFVAVVWPVIRLFLLANPATTIKSIKTSFHTFVSAPTTQHCAALLRRTFFCWKNHIQLASSCTTMNISSLVTNTTTLPERKRIDNFNRTDCSIVTPFNGSKQATPTKHAKMDGNLVVLFALLVTSLAVSGIQAQGLANSDTGNSDEAQTTPKNNLPECQDSKSICGYMQINSFGLSRVSICACKGQVDCPLWWNPFDGRTVRHGNDFYKYCGRRPKLSACRPNEIAYSSYGETDLFTGQKIADVQRAHCMCQSSHVLKANQTMFKMLESSYIYGTKNLCQKPERCGRKQICLSITETADSTLEKRHCGCPAGKYCPRDVRLAHERLEQDKGTLYHMRCI